MTCNKDNSINQQVVDKINSQFVTKFKQNLMANGFTDADINDIFSNNSYQDISSNDLAKTNETFDIAKSQMERLTKTNEINKFNTEQAMKSAEEVEMSEVQAAKQPVVKWPEPKFFGNLFTNPIDQPDANYTVDEDYPNTYGFIDKAKNWFKINQKKKYAEFVHSSGSALKIDEQGNVTIHIKGNLKFVIDGDLSQSIGGSEDHIVGGNSHQFIPLLKDSLMGTEVRLALGPMVLRGLPILEN